MLATVILKIIHYLRSISVSKYIGIISIKFNPSSFVFTGMTSRTWKAMEGTVLYIFYVKRRICIFNVKNLYENDTRELLKCAMITFKHMM
jgi:hypothetical protein